MKKYSFSLFTLFLFFVAIGFLVWHSRLLNMRRNVSVQKTFLCDAQVGCNDAQKIPKGVCIPGGSCTQ